MITIYNSNLDFDLDSSNSITLSSTSNMVFKTNGTDKMSIQNNGISVSGNVVVSGLITSTGAGFSGIGAGLSNIPISAINELRLELNGGTTDLSVTRDTLNASIVSEARFGSNYTGRINSELNTRVDNTSNYVLATSNILIGRIINTSNYIDSTSNFLSVRIDNTSNYALATSNILLGRIINTSNYVDSTSNFLSGRIDNTSNYALATSNILIGRIINTSNYVDSTSNFLSGRIDNTSNYALATSNILIGRIINASNYVESTSNTLIGRIINASNYVESTSNFFSGRIDNTSNYVLATSNTLIGRIINTSNYVLATSNILADYNNLINKPFQSNGANIFNNSGNVGIGTNATPLSLMEIITANYAGALLTLDAGVVNSTTQMPRNIGRPLLKLGKTSVSTSAGDYYGIGFGISPTLSDYNCAEIGTIITSTTGLETGDIIFSTRPSTNNVIATERMRITSAGNVGIGVTDTTTYKLNVGGTLNTTALYVNGTALTTTIGLKQDILTSANTIGVFNTTTDFVVNGDKIELTKNTSNYVTATSNLLSRRIDSTSNYSDRVGVWGSNYTDKADIWGSNYSDKVGVWGSNYAYDKVGAWSSNYTDRVGGWSSNYAYDKVGVWSSNYTDRVGGWGSNYAYDKVGVWSSNYTDRIGERTSNYVLATSNILIGRVIHTSNYVSTYKPATAVTADFANRFTNSVNIAGVPFNGTANINISYNNLDNQLSFGNGLSTSYDNITKITSVTANAAPQEQSDWTQTTTSSASFIKNKPTIPANTFQLNGSTAFYNSGNVGIGTTNPTSGALTIYGTSYTRSNSLYIHSGQAGIMLDSTLNGETGTKKYNIWSTRSVDSAGVGAFVIFDEAANNYRMIISSAGNVGIGTLDTATYKLNVNGTLNTTGLYVNGTAFTGSSQWTGTTDISNNTGNVAIGTTNTTTAKLFVNGSVRTGNVGIGTTNVSSYNLNVAGTAYVSSSLEVSGSTRFYSSSVIDGNLAIGTTDTSSYRLYVNGSSRTSSLYNTGTIVSDGNITTYGNVGIGTASSIAGKLHIYDTTSSTTSLIIQNNLDQFNNITSSPSAPIRGTSANYTYMMFTYTTETAGAGSGQTHYTLNIPSGNAVCDVLIVGGGGGGNMILGAGGGGGAVLYATGVTIPAGSYAIKVGKGGIRNVNGSQSEAFGAICLGGGSQPNTSWPTPSAGRAGGSGSGGSSGDADGAYSRGGVGASTKGTILSSGILYNGCNGGNGCRIASGTSFGGGGGGGGAVTEGGSSVQTNYSTRQDWINAGRPSGGGDGVLINITGAGYYWGAGGGGGVHTSPAGADGGLGGGGGGGTQGSSGGLGGTGGISAGGNGGQSSQAADGGNGGAHTGSGGGGSTFTGTSGSSGGSGVIIIRVLEKNSTIELIRGTSGDSNKDYKIGNYGGEFKIRSSVNNIDTDYIRITSEGYIFNATSSPYWTYTSDKRIKENIEKASYNKCYDNINSLELYRFNYINGFNNVNKDINQLGFIAQEVQDIFPKAVTSQSFNNKDISIPDLLSIDINQINFSLYGAVKKLIEMNDDKDRRINFLIEMNDDKEDRIKKIECVLNTSNSFLQ